MSDKVSEIAYATEATGTSIISGTAPGSRLNDLSIYIDQVESERDPVVVLCDYITSPTNQSGYSKGDVVEIGDLSEAVIVKGKVSDTVARLFKAGAIRLATNDEYIEGKVVVEYESDSVHKTRLSMIKLERKSSPNTVTKVVDEFDFDGEATKTKGQEVSKEQGKK